MSTPDPLEHTGPHRPWRGVTADQRIVERRRRLMDAGRRVMAERGPGAAGVNDVCAAAGLTKRYFYESFDSVESFVEAVFVEARDEMVDRISELAGIDDTPDEQAFVRALVRVLLDEPEYVRLLLEPFATHAGRSTYGDRLLEGGLELRRKLALPHLSDEAYAVRAYAVSGVISAVTRAWLTGAIPGDREVIAEELAALVQRMTDL